MDLKEKSREELYNNRGITASVSAILMLFFLFMLFILSLFFFNNNVVSAAGRKNSTHHKKTAIKIGVKNFSQGVNRIKYGTSKTLAMRVVVGRKKKNMKNSAFVFSSSDKDVLSVSKKGVIFGKETGKATLTIRYKKNKKIFKKVKVEITEVIKAIFTNQSSYSVFTGDCFQLACEVIPERLSSKIRFLSSNPNVCEVDEEGMCEARNEGYAIITIKAMDGSGINTQVEIDVDRSIGENEAKSLCWQDSVFVAHRGVALDFPENTIGAFERAIREGFSIIETDVRSTADGIYVMSHDSNTIRLSNVDAEISDLTYDELMKIPIFCEKLGDLGDDSAGEHHFISLDEFCSFCALANVKIQFELKERFTESQLREIVDTLGSFGLLDRIQFSSFVMDNLDFIRRELPDSDLLKLYNSYISKSDIQNCVNINANIAANAQHLKLSTIEEIKRAGLDAYVWTVNDAITALRFINRGVSGMSCDIAPFVIS